jgi:hypothetical protein
MPEGPRGRCQAPPTAGRCPRRAGAMGAGGAATRPAGGAVRDSEARPPGEGGFGGKPGMGFPPSSLSQRSEATSLLPWRKANPPHVPLGGEPEHQGHDARGGEPGWPAPTAADIRKPHDPGVERAAELPTRLVAGGMRLAVAGRQRSHGRSGSPRRWRYQSAETTASFCPHPQGSINSGVNSLGIGIVDRTIHDDVDVGGDREKE